MLRQRPLWQEDEGTPPPPTEIGTVDGPSPSDQKLIDLGMSEKARHF